MERAKESFLERLNRERAARQQEDKAYPEKLNNNNLHTVPVVGGKENSKERQAFPETQVSKGSDSKHSKKRKDNSLEKESSPRKQTSLFDNDKVSQTDARSDLSKREKKKKKHEVEEKILSSFKKFSSVWADSDNENEEGDFQAGHGMPHEKQQVGGCSSKPGYIFVSGRKFCVPCKVVCLAFIVCLANACLAFFYVMFIQLFFWHANMHFN